MSYLKSCMVAIGLNIGEIWFWDLNTSKFLPKDYDKIYKHEMKVRTILEFTHPKKKIEYLLTASDDGLILVWVISEEEMKQAKKNEEEKNLEKYEASLNIFCAKNTKLSSKYIEKLSYADLTELNKSLLNDLYKDPHESRRHSIKEKKLEKKQLIYKPEVKYCINIPHLMKNYELIDTQIYTLTYIPKTDRFFSAGEDNMIYVWNIESGNLMEVMKGHEAPINCLQNNEMNLIFSGSQDGVLNVNILIKQGLGAQ